MTTYRFEILINVYCSPWNAFLKQATMFWQLWMMPTGGEDEKSNRAAYGRQVFEKLQLLIRNRPRRFDNEFAEETLAQMTRLRGEAIADKCLHILWAFFADEVMKIQEETKCIGEEEYRKQMKMCRSYGIALTRVVRSTRKLEQETTE